VRRLLAGLGLGAALLTVTVARTTASGAAFTAATGSSGTTVAADSAATYLDLFSQGTDPAGLTGYAVKNLSNPPVLAATGSDLGLSLDLGGWKNGGTMNRALTIQARNPLPAASITVTTVVPPTPSQPVTAATIAAVGSAGGTTSATLTAGTKRQVNLTIVKLPGNNVLYTANIQLVVTYPGYTGSFLTYSVPVHAWDGNGGGP
jgi:hypothetical protein